MNKLRTLMVVLAIGMPIAALADIQAPPDPQAKPEAKNDAKPEAKPDREGFVPLTASEQLAPGEVLPATNLVGAAYGFILASLVVWIASVAVRARRVEEELAALRSQIDQAGRKA